MGRKSGKKPQSSDGPRQKDIRESLGDPRQKRQDSPQTYLSPTTCSSDEEDPYWSEASVAARGTPRKVEMEKLLADTPSAPRLTTARKHKVAPGPSGDETTGPPVAHRIPEGAGLLPLTEGAIRRLLGQTLEEMRTIWQADFASLSSKMVAIKGRLTAVETRVVEAEASQAHTWNRNWNLLKPRTEMTNPVTPSTYIRNLSLGLVRQLADFLDPQEGWKTIAVDIRKPSGEARYTQFHIRRYEGTVQKGKSPTCELLCDWGTTNCTVQDLADLLVKHQFLSAASLLLKDLKANPVHPISPVPIGCQSTKLLQKPETEKEPQPAVCASKSPEENKGNGTFPLADLRRITGNFDERPVAEGGNKLGEGGFGVVFQGKLNGRMVAVKKLTALLDASIQELEGQFEQEIKTMSKCEHENLVELLGYSSDGGHYCLVYVLMPNGSLLDRLACLDGTPHLSWHARCNIALGTAIGIKYLHDNTHVHRDIKSANILLDEGFVPKISDFGLARATDKYKRTVMTERIVGTTAYMAPEALRGEVTVKSDIFSFGVVLLEIISGLPPVDEERNPALLLDIKEEIEEEEKTLEEYIDRKMEDAEPDALEKMYNTASQCLHQMKNRRPDISTVLHDLKYITTTLCD
uniref:non-specific serine/threonine protein kinase n=1 Tax=Leptobrachium leishanense TaxID=445787 RepID=A0A8C5PGL9_9ANUR